MYAAPNCDGMFLWEEDLIHNRCSQVQMSVIQ